jgi:hypothetical protein
VGIHVLPARDDAPVAARASIDRQSALALLDMAVTVTGRRFATDHVARLTAFPALPMARSVPTVSGTDLVGAHA